MNEPLLREVLEMDSMIEPTLPSIINEVIIPDATDSTEVEVDYYQARKNLYAILNRGQEALDGALKIASQSDSPRAFEVVGNIMKQLSDINQQLLELSHKKQIVMNKSPQSKEESSNVTNNNTIFVGSTSDLSSILSLNRSKNHGITYDASTSIRDVSTIN